MSCFFPANLAWTGVRGQDCRDRQSSVVLKYRRLGRDSSLFWPGFTSGRQVASPPMDDCLASRRIAPHISQFSGRAPPRKHGGKRHSKTRQKAPLKCSEKRSVFRTPSNHAPLKCHFSPNTVKNTAMVHVEHDPSPWGSG